MKTNIKHNCEEIIVNKQLDVIPRRDSYIREFNKGKSFDFSPWCPLTKYTNNDFKQDFVSYNDVLLACKKTHVSEDPPTFIYDNLNNPIGVNSDDWYLVFSSKDRYIQIDDSALIFDENMNSESTNGVQNKVIKTYIDSTVEQLQSGVDSKLNELNIVTENLLTKKQDVIEDLDVIRTNAASALHTIPEEYITEAELNAKQYLTEIPGEYITESELINKNYVTINDLESKQDVLVSGTTIKTINDQSILGDGNVEVKAIVDSEFSNESSNPVENRIVTNQFAQTEESIKHNEDTLLNAILALEIRIQKIENWLKNPELETLTVSDLSVINTICGKEISNIKNRLIALE